MYSVNKRDNGKIPAIIIFSAAVSVMNREEAKILMTIKAKNNLNEEDLFENIGKAFQIIEDETENEKINENKNGNQIENEDRNFSLNSFQIFDERKEQMNMNMNMNMKKKNDVSGMKYRALTYLHSSLFKQKESLKNSLNSIATFDQKECIERNENENENGNENENERNCPINNFFQSNIEKKNNIRMQKNKNNSSSRNKTGNGTDSRIGTGTGTPKIVNTMSKNNKSHLLLSCKWLLQVTPHSTPHHHNQSTLLKLFRKLISFQIHEKFQISFSFLS